MVLEFWVTVDGEDGMPESVVEAEEDGWLTTLDFTLALLLILDLVFTIPFGLFVRLILLLVCPAWLRFTLEFCFMDDRLSNLDL